MMNTNRLSLRNVVAIAICLAAMTMFASCEKENIAGNPEIESIEIESIEIEGKNIATVKIIIGAMKPSEGIWGIANELASVKYQNGHLKLNFRAIVTDEYLGEYFPEGVTISEPNIKVGFLSVNACDNAGNDNGNFFYIDSGGCWNAQYIYANRDFTVTGNSKYGEVHDDCSFKKGWNIRYYNPLEGKFTTQKPLNVNFKWRYAKHRIQ